MTKSARFVTAVALLLVGLMVGPAHALGLPPITGARPAVPPEYQSQDRFLALERRLQQELVEAGDRDETLAFLSRGGFGDEGQIVVRSRAGLARLTFMLDRARSYERPMSAEELNGLRTFLLGRKAFDLAELKTQIADGMHNELLRLTKTGGRRVYMDNPGPVGARAYLEIREHFRSLLRKPGMTLRYPAQQQNTDLEVVVSDPGWDVVGVRMDGSQLLLQVRRGYPRADGDLAMPDTYQLKGKLPAVEVREVAWVTWPSVSLVTSERLSTLSLARIAVPRKIHTSEWLNRGGWASEYGGFRYIVGEVEEKEGLWRVSPSGQFDLVVAGKMSTPLVSVDGKSVVVDRTDLRSWGHSSYFARIDLQTRQLSRVEIPTANEMLPMLPTPGGILVKRARADPRGLPSDWNFQGPESAEYYLLDSGSGAVKKVEGNFEPLLYELANPLQATASGQIWASSADWEKNEESFIGRYDLKHFTFTPVRELHGLVLRTNDIWVDEKAAKVYAVYRGDLVRFSLRKP